MKSGKLLLLEVEVTISLSNLPSDEKKKVISIKKISEIFEEQPEEEDFIEADEMTLQLKVDQLQNEIKSLELQKEKTLEEIQTAIEQERDAWELQKEQEREEAQDVGYKVGYDAGYEKVFEQHEQLLNDANDIVRKAKEDYDKTISKYETAILNLAISIAEKITTKRIEQEPEIFQQMVQTAISDLKDSSNVEVYVHPTKYDLIISQKEELEQMVRNDDVISIYTDSSLLEHSCIIKHLYGQVDVSVDTQLQQIKNALEEKIMER